MENYLLPLLVPCILVRADKAFSACRLASKLKLDLIDRSVFFLHFESLTATGKKLIFCTLFVRASRARRIRHFTSLHFALTFLLVLD